MTSAQHSTGPSSTAPPDAGPREVLAVGDLDAAGTIVAYCCGNDLSSRSIEGENPLYVPQALGSLTNSVVEVGRR